MSNQLQSIKTVRPASHEELSKLFAEAAAGDIVILPGRERELPKEAMAELVHKPIVFVDLTSMDRVLEHCLEDQVVQVETGIAVHKLNQYLERSKQWWPVEALDDSVTVLDVLNAGEGGPLDNRFGGPRELVLGLDVVLASGERTKCGGRVVKNVTGYDLAKLFIGSESSLGIPTSAFLRLYALPETEATIAFVGNDSRTLVELGRQLTLSGLPFSALELIDSHLFYDLVDDNVVPEKLGVVLHQRQSVLLTRIHGHETEVAELFNESVAIGNKLNISGKQVDLPVARLLWKRLSSTAKYLEGQSLTLSVTWTQMTKIIEKWRAEHKFVLWQARPNMSMVKIFAKDVTTILELKESLLAFIKRHEEALVIAHADHQLEKNIEFVECDNQASQELKKALKEKFDPRGVLNPLVRL